METLRMIQLGIILFYRAHGWLGGRHESYQGRGSQKICFLDTNFQKEGVVLVRVTSLAQR
jgi:hypothetical protein